MSPPGILFDSALIAFAVALLITMIWLLVCVVMSIMPRWLFRNVKRSGGVGLRILGNVMQFTLVVPLVLFALIGTLNLLQALIIIPLMEVAILGIYWMGVWTIEDCDSDGHSKV
jgi:hypothetical protein